MKNDFSFWNLNSWRKAYIIFIWLGAILLSIYFTWACFIGESGLTIGYSIVPIGFLLFTTWKHFSIVNRKLNQIYWIAFLSFIPFGSLIGSLIMLSIARVTKNEIKAHEGLSKIS